ncbi:MAG: AAA family ATPase [Patescibacteria group bacterium]|nr:AAA family ATPase [Patescibacteria group bacterium]MCL5261908.1 AAA family ATPase [Patescibacteria group bacterium]
MLIGHERQQKLFDRLIREKALSGSYIFFGESQIGKFAFAESIVRKIEPRSEVLTECLTVKPDENGSIGIDAVRHLKRFLSEKPVNADLRSVIIDEAESLTAQAENALLKITEEPPEKSLIIMIVQNPDSLLQTLVSRFRKIYFSRVKSEKIASWLEKEKGISAFAAVAAADVCFGRPGLALQIAEKSLVVPDKLESVADYRVFIKTEMMKLYKDKIKNAEKIRELTHRLYFIEQFNTNKKLQLQAASWTR